MAEPRACDACGWLQSYPAPVCRGCGGRAFSACALPYRATIYSHTRVSRAPTPALQVETPYVAVLVRGTAGGLLLLRWQGAAMPVIGEVAVVDERDGVLAAGPPSESPGP